MAAKTTFFIFLIFLLMFPRLSPYNVSHVVWHSTGERLFGMYHFVVSQALGIVHEAGHGVCYLLPCPKPVMVAAGTVFQLGLPLWIAMYYRKRSQKMPYAIALFVTGFSLQYTAWYLSTAHEGLFLPASKSFLGVDSYHDFAYLLGMVGMISYDGVISALLKAMAYGLMIWAVIVMYLEAFSSDDYKARR